MTDNISFYNPTDIGYFDLGTTQINKALEFKSTEGVFDASSYVKFYLKASGQNKRTLFKTYTIGDGITLSGTNTQGQEKTAALLINGSDFPNVCVGSILEAECSFFVLGDVEIIFELQIK